MTEVADRPGRAFPSLGWLLDRLDWLVVLLGGIYLVLLLTRLPPLLGAVNWNSDSSSLFVLAELYDRGDAYRSTRGSWTTLWWLLLTRDWPGHRQLWLATSPALMILTAGLTGCSAWRVAGRRAAITVTAL